jgi:hypothetical protein
MPMMLSGDAMQEQGHNRWKAFWAGFWVGLVAEVATTLLTKLGEEVWHILGHVTLILALRVVEFLLHP